MYFSCLLDVIIGSIKFVTIIGLFCIPWDTCEFAFIGFASKFISRCRSFANLAVKIILPINATNKAPF